MTERPWMKWYPGDWRADPKLAACEPMSRYVWFEMIGLMHEGEPYGHLTVNSKKMTPEVLASLIRTPLKVVNAALRELEANAVFNRTDDGVIFSRRMVRDELRATSNKVNGAKGGNPILKKQQHSSYQDNPTDNMEDITQSPEARDQRPKAKNHQPVGGEGTLDFGEADLLRRELDVWFRNIKFGAEMVQWLLDLPDRDRFLQLWSKGKTVSGYVRKSSENIDSIITAVIVGRYSKASKSAPRGFRTIVTWKYFDEVVAEAMMSYDLEHGLISNEEIALKPSRMAGRTT